MTYVKRILIAIDQLGNAIAGGNEDCTISGRTGYFAENSHISVRWYWLFLQFVIDLTFYPWDGPGHCKMAAESEQDEMYLDVSTSKKVLHILALIVLTLIVIASCSIMMPLFWLIYGIKKFIEVIFILSKEK